MENLGRWIVKLRWPILAATLAVMVGSAALMPRLRIDASSKNLLFVEKGAQEAFQRYVNAWGGDRFLSVAVQWDQGDAFTAERLAYLRRLTQRLEKLPGVQRVESLTNVTTLSARGQDLYAGALVPTPVPQSKAALGRVKEQALASPLMRRVYYDDTGRMVAVNLWLKHSDDDVKVVMQTTRKIRRIVNGERKAGRSLHLFGGPEIVVAVFDITRRDTWVLTLAPFVLVGLLLLVLLRSVRGALLPMACIAATALATFGAMAATDTALNLVTAMLPSLLMVIGVADVVHVLVAHSAARQQELDREAAVVQTVARVGWPCLLTSLTTAVGFGSLRFSAIPQVQEFGVFAAVGVMMAFVFSVVSIPAALAVLPGAVPKLHKETGRIAGLDRLLLALGRAGRKAPVVVVLVTVAALVVGVTGVRRLQVESSALTYLPKDHPVLRDLYAAEPHLMGSTPLIVHLWDRRPGRPGRPESAKKIFNLVEPPAMAPSTDEVIDDPEDTPVTTKQVAPPKPTGAERFKDPKVLAAIDHLTRVLQAIPGVRKVLSVTEYLKEVNRVMHGGGAEHYRLPTEGRLIAAYLELAASRDPRTLAQLINWERSAVNVTAMCVAHSSAAMRDILAEVKKELARPETRTALGPDVQVDVTGLGPLLSHVSDRIVASQLSSLFVALGVICVMLVLVLWSVRVGLSAMLPNLLPIGLTVGLMGWLGVTLNITTVMIASIALGIAVDDTIHFLIRARDETRRTGDAEQGIEDALRSVGRALVFTTCVVSGGFLVLLLATLTPARHFGALSAVAMCTALAADLVLLPVLLRWIRPWTRKRTPTKTGTETETETKVRP